MDALTLTISSFLSVTSSSSSSVTINSSSSSSSLPSLSGFSPYNKTKTPLLRSTAKAKGRDDEYETEIGSSNSKERRILPLPDNRCLSLSPLSKDTAMGLVLSAAGGRGWTTCSGMEGPSEPAGDAESTAAKISTFPWSLFTKSPRRRMLIAFTCNICTQRTTRAINPHAYTDGTVFVQCCGCNAYHKLVDNLNLFDGMKCYLNSSFKFRGDGSGVNFEFRDVDNGDESDDGFFSI